MQTWFIKAISILFSAPDDHLRILQKCGLLVLMMNKAVWRVSLRKVIEGWQELTLYVESYRDCSAPKMDGHVGVHHRAIHRNVFVFLNANVAFLVTRLLTPCAETLSISNSFGSSNSIVIGLLVRQKQLQMWLVCVNSKLNMYNH